MIDDVDDIAAFYGEDPAREHQRLDRHQLEHDLTWRYLERYLPRNGSVLEIGAATGRYTAELARRGYSVTAVDLSNELVEQAQRRVSEAGLERRVQLFVADARDLTEVTGSDFDAVLIMGPLYHLIDSADREMALQQAVDRLRPGGVVFSSFLSRFGVFGDLMRKSPDWIEDQAQVRSLLERGRRPDGRPQRGFRGYFVHVSEIVPLHDAAGVEVIALAGVEPAISALDESFNALAAEQRELWLDLLYEISTEPSIVGASRHLLYIGRKPTRRSGGRPTASQ